jgi:DNA-binding NarL/FixJ family response regulator
VRQVTQPISSEPDTLGLIWIDCRFSVLSAGLTETLKNEGRIYQGIKPPEKEAPSFIIVCVETERDPTIEVKRLRAQVPDATILVFGLSSDLRLVRAALQAGARGFIHLGMQPSQIVRSLRVASKGEIAIPRHLLKDLFAGDGQANVDDLTSRQRQILELVVEGLTNAQIAQQLFLSESTIKQHLRATYKTLKVRNRTEAARLYAAALSTPYR